MTHDELMSMHDESSIRSPSTVGGERERRRPYAPPRIVAREGLEAMAAACVPSPPGKTAGFCSLASS